jgi:hypothetical protein
MCEFAARQGVPILWVLGGAVGVDRQAEALCIARGWAHAVLYPLWSRYGRIEAPKRRNLDMVAMVATSRRGTFLAFPQPQSRGTYHCMAAARLVHLRLFVAAPSIPAGWRL